MTNTEERIMNRLSQIEWVILEGLHNKEYIQGARDAIDFFSRKLKDIINEERIKKLKFESELE